MKKKSTLRGRRKVAPAVTIGRLFVSTSSRVELRRSPFESETVSVTRIVLDASSRSAKKVCPAVVAAVPARAAKSGRAAYCGAPWESTPVRRSALQANDAVPENECDSAPSKTRQALCGRDPPDGAPSQVFTANPASGRWEGTHAASASDAIPIRPQPSQKSRSAIESLAGAEQRRRTARAERPRRGSILPPGLLDGHTLREIPGLI